MVDQIRAYIEQYHMIEEQDIVLLGVSGGADSVGLLLVLYELKKTWRDFLIAVVHVEHGIRGEDSLRDARFVENLCKKLGVKLFLTSVSVPDYAKSNHLGYEEAARILRYQAFEDTAKQLTKQGKKVKVALAHHRNDNAETVLFQMVRGSGLTGMCGMQPVRKGEGEIHYIRPLLCVGRSEIEEFLAKKGQEYCTDATNFELDYSRNRIRNLVIPELLEVNSQAVAHISQTIEQLLEVRDFLMEEAKKSYQELVTVQHMEQKGEKSLIIMNAEGLKKLHRAVAKEVIRMALFEAAGKKKDFTAVHISDVLALCGMQSGRRIMLPYGLIAQKEYGTILMKEQEQKKVHQQGEWEIPVLPEQLSGEKFEIPLPDGEMITFQMRKFSGNMEEIPKKPYTKWLDYDMIKNGFFLRYRRPGDYFYTGTDGRKKKLKEYFVNEKIPQSRRNKMPLIARESEILCIPEGRISASCLVTENTRYILEIIYNGGK